MLVNRVPLFQILDHFHCFGGGDVLVVFHGNKEEVVAVADFPPAGHKGQVHGGIAAAVETEDQRHGTVGEQVVVIVGEIAHLVGFHVLDGPVVRRSVNGYAAGVFRHVQGFEIGLQLDLSAPHLEMLYKGVEVRFIFSFVLDQQVFAAVKGLVDLRTVSDAEDRDVLPLYVRHNAQAFHGAHGGSDLAGSPEVFTLQGL